MTPADDSRTTRELDRLGREWDELAETDALWAVLSDPGRKGGGWTVDEFLAAGEQEIAAALAASASRYGRPTRHERALDFGCGAGRLSYALSSRFDEVVGVDVSREMIAAAERLLAPRPNVRLVVNQRPSLEQFDDATFDVVYTSLVLQHLPTPALVAGFVRELTRVTAPDGIAIVQAPSSIPWRYRAQPLRRGYAALRRLGVPARALLLRTPLQPMRMTALPRERVEQEVAAAGGTLLGLEPDGAFGFRYSIAGGGRSISRDEEVRARR